MEQQIKALKQSPMFSVIWSLMALCSRNTTHGRGGMEGSMCIQILPTFSAESWLVSKGLTRKYKNAVLKNQPFQAPWSTLLSFSFGHLFFFFFPETAAETFFFNNSEVYPKTGLEMTYLLNLGPESLGQILYRHFWLQLMPPQTHNAHARSLGCLYV